MRKHLDLYEHGLFYGYYEGSWAQLPDFRRLTPVRTGVAFDLDLRSIRPVEDHWGVVYSGFFEIQREGEYKFTIISDDGSKLFVDGTLIVDNDGSHSKKEESGKTYLMEGRHPVVLQYFEDYAGEFLEVLYEGPGVQRQSLPLSAFFRHKQ